jgi:hypothetical protein
MAIAPCIHVQKGVMQMDQNEILYDIFFDTAASFAVIGQFVEI